MSDLVGNPEDRFSHAQAHFSTCLQRESIFFSFAIMIHFMGRHSEFLKYDLLSFLVPKHVSIGQLPQSCCTRNNKTTYHSEIY